MLGEIRLDGIAVYCARLARALECRVVLVTAGIALPDTPAGRRILDAFDEVRVVEGPLAGLSLARVLSLARLFRRLRADVIHVHELHLLKVLSPAARLARVPVAGTSHLGAAGSSAWNRRSKRLFALCPDNLFCDVYFAISEEIADDYAQVYGVRPGRVRKVPTGVDLERFRVPARHERASARAALGLPADATVYLQLGRLAAVKDPLLTLEAFAAFARGVPDGPDAPHGPAFLLFAGEGELEAQLRARAEALGLGERVRFLGFVDPLEALRAADVLSLPSVVEGSAMVVVEAMACGVVPVRTRTQGYRDQIVDGENGFGIDVGDAAALAASLRRLHDPEVRRVMASRARETAVARFDFRDTAAAVRDAYARLGASPPPGERLHSRPE